jgi:site-specific recombinase XerC
MGIPHTVHHIRHGFATKLLKNGMALKALKELLGHKDIKTTMRYGHLEASDVSPEAARILNEQNAARREGRSRAGSPGSIQ